MRIGELAAMAGVSTRAVRHYHASGVLPEPLRRSNGYREYGADDLLRLLRVVRLTDLGLNLAEVRSALTAEAGDVRALLAQVISDLEEQEALLRSRRIRLAAALASDAAWPTTPEVSALLDRLAWHQVDPRLRASEQSLLELSQASMSPTEFAALSQAYAQLTESPEATRLGAELGARLAELSSASPDNERVTSLAADLAEASATFGEFFGQAAGPAADEAPDSPWALFLDTMSPAQQECLRLAAELHDAAQLRDTASTAEIR